MGTIYKERLHYIDIAKGLLILMVVYVHTQNLAVAQGVNNSVIDFIPKTYFYKPFFMPAFFVITGMCSDFNKKIKDFVISNAKALLIPAILLLFVRMAIRFMLTGTFNGMEGHELISWRALYNLGKYNWFLTALFTTKLMFYGVHSISKTFKSRLAIVVALHILGVLLIDLVFSKYGEEIVFRDFYFYQHALIYLLYIEIGYDIAKKNLHISPLWQNMLIYFAIMTLYCVLNRRMPFVTYTISIPILDMIPHLVLSVCGSIMIIQIAKKINNWTIAEELGKHTLVIYCLHFQFVLSFYEIFKDQFNSMGRYHTMTALLIMYTFTIVGCLYSSKLLHTKYLKWILGKF